MDKVAFLTLGQIAQRYGVPTWRVRRLFERGLLPPAPRAGAYRLVHLDDLPIVEAALRQAGYLTSQETAPCA